MTRTLDNYWGSTAKPNIFPPIGTQQYNVTWPSVNGKAPTIDWNAPNTLDPIAYGNWCCNTNYYNGSCGTSNSSIASNFTIFDWINLGALCVQNFFNIGASVAGIVNASKGNDVENNGFSGKENKEIDKMVADIDSVDVALKGSVETADTLINNNSVDKDALQKASENLIESSGLAQKQINQAGRNISTAEETIKKQNITKVNAENEINGLNNKIATLYTDIDSLKSQLASAGDDRKDSIKQAISSKEDELKQAEKDLKKQKKIFEQARRIIEVQTEIKNQNQANIDALQPSVNRATSLINSLDVRIGDANT